MDWKPRIGLVLKIQEGMRAIDTLGVYQYGVPLRGTPDIELSEAERSLSVHFPDDYREFLKQSGGWRSFFQNVYLFGAKDLLGGGLMDRARTILGECIKPPDSRWLPIGVSDTTVDVFAANVDSWEFCWFRYEIIERRPSFLEFFDLFIEYNRNEAIALPEMYKENKEKMN